MLNTKELYMKESYSFAGNAIIKQLQGEVLLNTKGQYMKKSNILACIVASNLLIGQMSKGTKENFILQVIVKVDKNLNKSKR